jgi:replicative DNA helicase
VEAATELSRECAEDGVINTCEGMEAARAQYEKSKKLKGVLGIPWPWPTMTEITGGVEDGNVYAFYGPEGTMKTWIALVLAHYFQVTCGKIVTFFTFEMTKEEILCRYAAMRAKVDWGRWRRGAMHADEEQAFYAELEAVKSDTPFYIIELSEPGASAITAIKAHMKEHKSEVVVVDGLSFVTQGLDWESFGEMNLGIRKLALRSRTPFIVTHHSNRSNKKINKASSDTSDVALGGTLARYVSLLVRLVREMRQEENDEVVFTLPKVREGKRKIITIHAKPAIEFSEKYSDDPTQLAERGVDVGDDGIL